MCMCEHVCACVCEYGLGSGGRLPDPGSGVQLVKGAWSEEVERDGN